MVLSYVLCSGDGDILFQSSSVELSLELSSIARVIASIPDMMFIKCDSICSYETGIDNIIYHATLIKLSEDVKCVLVIYSKKQIYYQLINTIKLVSYYFFSL